MVNVLWWFALFAMVTARPYYDDDNRNPGIHSTRERMHKMERLHNSEIWNKHDCSPEDNCRCSDDRTVREVPGTHFFPHPRCPRDSVPYNWFHCPKCGTSFGISIVRALCRGLKWKLIGSEMREMDDAKQVLCGTNMEVSWVMAYDKLLSHVLYPISVCSTSERC